jgi:hypothetical protein
VKGILLTMDNLALAEDNRSLRQCLQAKDQLILAKDQMIANLLQQLASIPSAPSPTPPADPAAPQLAVVTQARNTGTSISNLKTKNPDVWSGTRATLPRFLASCRSKFMLEPHNFPTEFSKIGFTGSYLSGTPQDWWHTLFQRYENALDKGNAPPAELSSFSLFSQALTTSYGDPDLKGTMERKLYTLRQTSSVANYAAEFQRIASYLAPGWSDEPLIFLYKLHLKENIKDALVHEKPYPKTVLDMVAATIRLDLREYEKTTLAMSTNGYAQE